MTSTLGCISRIHATRSAPGIASSGLEQTMTTSLRTCPDATSIKCLCPRCGGQNLPTITPSSRRGKVGWPLSFEPAPPGDQPRRGEDQEDHIESRRDVQALIPVDRDAQHV